MTRGRATRDVFTSETNGPGTLADFRVLEEGEVNARSECKNDEP